MSNLSAAGCDTETTFFGQLGPTPPPLRPTPTSTTTTLLLESFFSFCCFVTKRIWQKRERKEKNADRCIWRCRNVFWAKRKRLKQKDWPTYGETASATDWWMREEEKEWNVMKEMRNSERGPKKIWCVRGLKNEIEKTDHSRRRKREWKRVKARRIVKRKSEISVRTGERKEKQS